MQAIRSARIGGLGTQAQSRSIAPPLPFLPLLGVLIAALIAAWAYTFGDQPIFGDAAGYFGLAQDIASGGLGAFASDQRTYGYPALVAAIMLVVGQEPTKVQLAVFLAQFGALVGAAWIGSRRIAGCLGRDDVGGAVFLVTVTAPFPLMHAVQILTDLPAALVAYLSITLSLPQRRRESRGQVLLFAVCSLFCAGFAVMLRPAQLALAPVVGGIWIARAVTFRDVPWSAAPVALLAFLLPFAPQAYANQRAFGVPHPMIVRNLYGHQAEWGLRSAKYATLVLPQLPEHNRLFYENPFKPEGDLSVGRVLREQPGAYMATLAVHAFALIDQDFPFTYIRELDAWYRWPLSILNYLFYLGALVGSAVGLMAPGARDQMARRRQRWVLLALLAAAAATVAVYLPTAVESRFSLPLYLLLPTPFVLAAQWLGGTIRGRRLSLLTLCALASAVWVAGAAAASVWVQSHAVLLPYIREALANPPSEPLESPRAQTGSEIPMRFTANMPATVEVTITNTGTQAWKKEGLYPVSVSVRFVAENTRLHNRVQGRMKSSQVTQLPSDVEPGAEVTVPLEIVAPPEPGRYTFTIHMARVGTEDGNRFVERVVTVTRP